MSDLEENYKNPQIFEDNFVDFAIFPQVRHQWGYQKVKILDKRPRESTDFEEYIFLVPKNIM